MRVIMQASSGRSVLNYHWLQVPPEGEFALINYRTSSGFKPPFRLMTTVEPDPQVNTKAVLTLRLWWVSHLRPHFGSHFRGGRTVQ
jgi:hypothetical protein